MGSHNIRSSASPYPYTLYLLVQSFFIYQHFFYTYTPLPYPSIFQVTFLSYQELQFYSYTFFTNFIFHSLNMTKAPQHILFTHSPALICTSSHATPSIHAYIALTLISCHTTCFSQIINFHSTHSWLLHSVQSQNHWSIHQCWQENIVPLSIHVPDACSYELLSGDGYSRRVFINSCPYILSLHVLILSISSLLFFSCILALCPLISLNVVSFTYCFFRPFVTVRSPYVHHHYAQVTLYMCDWFPYLETLHALLDLMKNEAGVKIWPNPV